MTDQQRQLVADNQRLAAWIAEKWRNPLIEFEDKRQIALEGICKAAMRYDPEKGRFSTLAIRYATVELLKVGGNKRRPPVFSLETVVGHGRYGNEQTLADTLEDKTDIDENLGAWDVLRCIERVGGRYGELLRLKAAGMKYHEIAPRYGVTKQMIGREMILARAKLREVMGGTV